LWPIALQHQRTAWSLFGDGAHFQPCHLFDLLYSCTFQVQVAFPIKPMSHGKHHPQTVIGIAAKTKTQLGHQTPSLCQGICQKHSFIFLLFFRISTSSQHSGSKLHNTP